MPVTRAPVPVQAAPPAGPAAGTLLDVLDERPRHQPAVEGADGRMLSVGALLDAVHASARGTGAAPGGVTTVPPDDPVAAVVALLTAQRLGAVPVVAPGRGADAVRARAAELPVRYPEAGPLLVVVTSGTGGRPRAVVRTAASWQASLPGYDALLGPAAGVGTVGWAPGPPSSTLTLFALWHALATGRPAVAPGRWRATPAAAGAGRAARVVHCVPTVLADLLDAREAGLLPRLRRAVVAGSVLGRRLRERAAALGLQVAEYYGAAELSFVAADPDGTGLRAFPGAEVAVRADGTIWVRSPYLSLGYLDPDAAAPLVRDGAGWAGVGDLGHLSPSGVLTVRGRGDGTATVGGATVTLADVELALADLPGVAELVVLAEPDARLDERVLAVVRPAAPPGPAGPAAAGHPGGHADLVRALRAVARDRLPPPARPVRWVVRDDLPRTGAGKVARAALLEAVRSPAGSARTLGS